MPILLLPVLLIAIPHVTSTPSSNGPYPTPPVLTHRFPSLPDLALQAPITPCPHSAVPLTSSPHIAGTPQCSVSLPTAGRVHILPLPVLKPCQAVQALRVRNKGNRICHKSHSEDPRARVPEKPQNKWLRQNPYFQRRRNQRNGSHRRHSPLPVSHEVHATVHVPSGHWTLSTPGGHSNANQGPYMDG